MQPRIIRLVLLVLCACSPMRAEKLTVAAAANLSPVMDALNAAYRKANPGDEVTTVTGASGSFFAQIKNGAPIDVLLSADLDYPRKLADAGHAEAASLLAFATGRLVLWTANPNIKLADIASALADPRVKHIAIANPATAPYGRAAREALGNLNLWASCESRCVQGENIAQTAQFVETGNAEVGFVALSLVVSPKFKNKGSYLEVPRDLHQPLDQGAVITRHGAANAAAGRYIGFLKTRAARDVLESYGYGVPPAP